MNLLTKEKLAFVGSNTLIEYYNTALKERASKAIRLIEVELQKRLNEEASRPKIKSKVRTSRGITKFL